ncbi:MAG TPA: DUF2066 domain-containing protein [Rudaea sp.]
MRRFPTFPGLIVLVLACLLPLAASAGAGGLYTGQVPVNSQSDTELAEALKTAFGQVLVKLIGDAGALSRPEVAKAVAQPNRYVQQYQYEQAVVTENGQPQVRMTLVAQFNRESVDRLLGELGLAPGAAAAAAADTAPANDVRPGTYHLWVGGIRSAEDYARLIGAFSGNERVRDVQTELARGDGVQLRVGVVGPLARVLDTLSATAGVRVTNAAPPVEGMDALLTMP